MDNYLAELLEDLKEIGEIEGISGWVMFEDWELNAVQKLRAAGLVVIDEFAEPHSVSEENGIVTEFAFRARAI